MTSDEKNGSKLISVSRLAASLLDDYKREVPCTRPSRGTKQESYNDVIMRFVKLLLGGPSIDIAGKILSKLSVYRYMHDLSWEDISDKIDELFYP